MFLIDDAEYPFDVFWGGFDNFKKRVDDFGGEVDGLVVLSVGLLTSGLRRNHKNNQRQQEGNKQNQKEQKKTKIKSPPRN